MRRPPKNGRSSAKRPSPCTGSACRRRSSLQRRHDRSPRCRRQASCGRPGPLLQRDVLAEIDRRRPIVERMAERAALERAAARVVATTTRLRGCSGQGTRRRDPARAAGARAASRRERVFDVRMDVQRLVRRDRPRRRRPDDAVRGSVERRRETERRPSFVRSAASVSGKPTSTAMSARSSYSPSASASALRNRSTS
jgi:hypothetical protein